LIESTDHDRIIETVDYYHSSKNRPLTSLIQNGKEGNETDSNSSIDISDTNEGDETAQKSSIDVIETLKDKVGNKFTRNSNIAVNRILEETEVSMENNAKMMDNDETFDVTTPWNTNYDVSIDIESSVLANESDQSNKDDQKKYYQQQFHQF
jgi:hypothetical protein